MAMSGRRRAKRGANPTATAAALLGGPLDSGVGRHDRSGSAGHFAYANTHSMMILTRGTIASTAHHGENPAFATTLGIKDHRARDRTDTMMNQCKIEKEIITTSLRLNRASLDSAIRRNPGCRR